RREPPARHHAVQMRMVQQVLAPGVQDRDEADLGAQVRGVRSDRAQRLGGGAEQQVVDHRLVLVGDGGDLLRQGEHDMEILDWQELCAPILEPLRARERLALWTMPVAAAVERDPLVAAGVALLDVPPERRRAATLDGTHDAALPATQCRHVIATIGWPELPEDVRQLEPGWAQD